MKDRDLEVIEKIQDIVKNLDEIDKMISSQSEELRQVDFEISDLLHLIQEANKEDLNAVACVNIIYRLRDLRIKRKALNNEYEIENTFTQHKSKLPGGNTRQFLANEIFKTTKNLNQPYKNRVLTEEDINKLFSNKIINENEMEVPVQPKRKRGRPRKVVDNDLSKIMEFNQQLEG